MVGNEFVSIAFDLRLGRSWDRSVTEDESFRTENRGGKGQPRADTFMLRGSRPYIQLVYVFERLIY